MIEEWKDIPNHKGLYKISDLGNVKSLYSNKILKPSIDKYGYTRFSATKDKIQKTLIIHRLVAKLFIPNPNNLPQVNHKDEDKLNNSIDNLEWCTSTYNHSYGTGNIRRKVNQKAKAVVQYTTNNSYINSFFSIKEAERVTGIKSYNISAVCKNKRKIAGGYIWSYEKLDKQES